jgi:hypothetical protein
MDVHELIKWRWREERNDALRFCCFGCGMQAIAASLYFYFGDGSPFLPETPRLVSKILAGLLFPVGWVVAIAAVASWRRGLSLKRDLAHISVVTVSGMLTKCRPIEDFDSGKLEPDQFVTMQGVSGWLTVPLQFWETMPDTQQASCQYLRLAKLVYRINGVNPWEMCQQGGGHVR